MDTTGCGTRLLDHLDALRDKPLAELGSAPVAAAVRRRLVDEASGEQRIGSAKFNSSI